jgi:N-acetylglucosaminyl-diphospho-decaprenol L-rhamnosyltransferase
VYNYICKKFKPNSTDLFICLNPDVLITNETLLCFVDEVIQKSYSLATINLYLDSSFTEHDNSVRNFPSIWDFIKSFLRLNSDYIIDKSKITKPIDVDWCAGSFISITFHIYKKLQGFDEKYYMYCEDLDLCYRYHTLTRGNVKFLPHLKAQHLAGLQNRKLFSRHFVWHLSSVFTFIKSKTGRYNICSSVKR